MTQRNQSSDAVSDSASDEFEGYKFRIVLLGEAAVGKTSLLRRYTENTFDEEYKQTIGTTFATKDVDVTDSESEVRKVRLNVWDMGGQSTYRELRRQFMKGASAAIIVYDVTRPETFMAMNNWFESFKEVCPESPVLISANKIDLTDKRMVPNEPGVMLKDWFQAEYFETSAKTGDEVNNIFSRTAEVVLTKALTESKDPLR
ncbi:MAG: Rab family GTPase [Candidatus Thorarchaeota archaeon]